MKNKKITLKIWNEINSFCSKNALYKKGDNILLGVSGGPDSMLMLDYFAKMRRVKKINVFACHLNHGIRGKESDKDEKFTATMCKKYGIAFLSTRISVSRAALKRRKSLEHAARNERYKFFARTARKLGCQLIATAHHSDDNTETILLNLIRGTNTKGLAGIPAKRVLKSGNGHSLLIIRPLLSLRKKEIENYLKANKIPFRKDKTNEDEKYTRNWIRKKLLPLIESKQPKFRKHLLRISAGIQKILSEPGYRD